MLNHDIRLIGLTRSLLGLVVVLALGVPTTWAQFSTGTGTSGGGFTNSAGGSGGLSGFGASASGAGTGGSFRPNNSTIGSSLGLNSGISGSRTNPFETSRVDPRALGGVVDAVEAPVAIQQADTPGGQNRSANQGRPAFRLQVPSVTQVAFDIHPSARPNVENNVRQSFQRTTVAGFQGLSVRHQSNGRVVISGQAETPRHARLAAALASLEPGVRQIENNVRVARP